MLPVTSSVPPFAVSVPVPEWPVVIRNPLPVTVPLLPVLRPPESLIVPPAMVSLPPPVRLMALLPLFPDMVTVFAPTASVALAELGASELRFAVLTSRVTVYAPVSAGSATSSPLAGTEPPLQRAASDQLPLRIPPLDCQVLTATAARAHPSKLRPRI